MKNKYCCRCKKYKNINEFYKHKRTGYRSYCIDCTKELAKQDYKKNKNSEKYQEIIDREQKRRLSNPEKTLYTAAKQRAKKNNIDFDIDIEDVQIPLVCPILGIKIKHNNKGFQPGSPSIDRIDNTKGYIKSNIRVISNRANLLKRDAVIEELEKIIDFYDIVLEQDVQNEN